jgi:hypothetical protein
MTDLVKRLREWCEEGCYECSAYSACCDAADEIERLQRVIDRCGHKIQLMLKFGYITPRAEIDALLAEMTTEGINDAPSG